VQLVIIVRGVSGALTPGLARAMGPFVKAAASAELTIVPPNYGQEP